MWRWWESALTAGVSPSWTFFYACLAFLIGSTIGLFVYLPLYGMYAVLWVLAICFIFTIYRLPFPAAIFAITFALLLGGFRASQSEAFRKSDPFFAYVGRTVSLTGSVPRVPEVQGSTTRFTVMVEDSNASESLVGHSISVVVKGNLALVVGDNVELRCRISINTFGVSTGDPECAFPTSVTINSSSSLSLAGGLERVRSRFVSAIRSTFSPDAGGLVSGLLIGGTGALSTVWKQALITTGTIHLVALSGFNISIIAAFLTLLLQLLYLPRRWHLFVIGIMLSLFVVMVGAHASIIRAAIMGMLVVFARSLGRRSSPGNALALSAVVMVAITPRLILYDVGFQLSFLATIGIIYLYPPLDRLLRKVPDFLKLKEALLMSLAAEFAVFPLLLYWFGTLSIISPLVNMLVVPFIPFIMLFGFVGSMTSLVSLPLGRVLGLPAEAGVRFVLFVIGKGGILPWGSVAFVFPLPALIVSYLCFVGLFIYLVPSARRSTFFLSSRVG